MLFVECKTKRWLNGPKHTPLLLWWLYDYGSANLNKQNRLTWFCIPTILHCFQKLAKTNFLLMDFLKTCQSILHRHATFLTFGFITTTLHDVLKKADINVAMAYSLHGHISYIPEVNFKRPIRKKRKRIRKRSKICCRNWMGWFFLF